MKTIQVVHILSEFEVVIDAGANDGLKPGMKALVYTQGPMIMDIDGSPLEALEIVKGIGRISHLQGRIATLGSLETTPSSRTIKKTTGGFGLALGLVPNVTEEAMAPEAAPFRGPQIGDLIRLL